MQGLNVALLCISIIIIIIICLIIISRGRYFPISKYYWILPLSLPDSMMKGKSTKGLQEMLAVGGGTLDSWRTTGYIQGRLFESFAINLALKFHGSLKEISVCFGSHLDTQVLVLVMDTLLVSFRTIWGAKDGTRAGHM